MKDPTHPSAMSKAKLRPDSEARVPIRAALSASIAIALAYLYPSQRWYWAVLVAVLLVSGSFGEGTRKGLTRFGMTAVGCVVAWLLSLLLREHATGRVAVMLVCIFLSVYFRGASYGWFTFFITVYVVFLFAVFGAPTAQTTVFRVWETFIGCGIALAASLIVPMPFARRQWEDEAAKFWRTCREQVARSYERLLGPTGNGGVDSGETNDAPSAVPRQLSVLAARHATSNFETFFSRRQQNHRYEVMVRVRRLGQAVLALDHVASAGVSSAAISAMGADLAVVRDATLTHLEAARRVERLAWAGSSDSGGPEANRPTSTAADALLQKLVDARDAGSVTAEEFLVLEAVGEFSAEIVRLVSEAEFQSARGSGDADPGGRNSQSSPRNPASAASMRAKPAMPDARVAGIESGSNA